jgi:hypothetical protein
MYARVVRFTDVSPERFDEMNARIESDDGPPPGVPAQSIKVFYDQNQATAVVVVYFENEDDMRKGGEALDQIDTSETPGTRASVDLCEVKAEMDVG